MWGSKSRKGYKTTFNIYSIEGSGKTSDLRRDGSWLLPNAYPTVKIVALRNNKLIKTYFFSQYFCFCNRLQLVIVSSMR